MQLEEEGCLSVPGFNATVARPARAVSGASIAMANQQSVEASGLLARCFQHEMDHLDGTLFVDRLRGLQKDLIVARSRSCESRQSGNARAHRVLRDAGVCRSVSADGPDRVSPHGRRRRRTQPDRPRGRGQRVTIPPVKAVARVHGTSRFSSRHRLREPASSARVAARHPISPSSPVGKLIPEDILVYPGWA